MKVIFIILFMLLGSQAFACGGKDISDDQLKSSADIQSIMVAIEVKYSTPVEITDIIRSENIILDLDQNEVARAMCPAKYINVYFESEVQGQLKCMITGTFNNDETGAIHNKEELVVACAENNGQPEKVEVLFK